MESKKNINDQLVIAGLFREALFHSSSVVVDGKYNSSVEDIVEQDRRSRVDERQFAISKIDFQFEMGIYYSFQIYFSSIVISFKALFIFNSEDSNFFSMPKELEAFNRRMEERLNINYLNSPPTPVLLSTKNSHAEGIFYLKDVSKHGCGGEILVDCNFTVLPQTLINGIVSSRQGSIEINGTVIRADVMLQTSKESKYFVHIGRVNRNEGSDLGTNDERRKMPRILSNLRVTSFRS